MRTHRICKQCNTLFLCEKWRKKGRGVFCSIECSASSKRRKIEKICKQCCIKFLCSAYKVGAYCSKPCQYKGQSEKLKKNPLKYWLGKHLSRVIRQNISRGRRGIVPKWSEEFIRRRKLWKEDNNPTWKGDNVGYSGLHKWIPKHLGKPSTCEHCGKSRLKGKQIHWANKSGKYLRDLNDWLRLCASCHAKYDGRGNKGWNTRRKKYAKLTAT